MSLIGLSTSSLTPSGAVGSSGLTDEQRDRLNLNTAEITALQSEIDTVQAELDAAVADGATDAELAEISARLTTLTTQFTEQVGESDVSTYFVAGDAEAVSRGRRYIAGGNVNTVNVIQGRRTYDWFELFNITPAQGAHLITLTGRFRSPLNGAVQTTWVVFPQMRHTFIWIGNAYVVTNPGSFYIPISAANFGGDRVKLMNDFKYTLSSLAETNTLVVDMPENVFGTMTFTWNETFRGTLRFDAGETNKFALKGRYFDFTRAIEYFGLEGTLVIGTINGKWNFSVEGLWPTKVLTQEQIDNEPYEGRIQAILASDVGA